MQSPKHLYRARDTLVAVCLVFGASGLRLQAAKAPKVDAQSSAPVLMSRTGGGNSWADLKELEAAAAKGNPKAEAQLGEMLLRGDGIAKNEVRAVMLLEKAARAGQSAAAFRIGMLLMNGESGVAKDPARALEYFRAAAAGGEKEAFFNIGAAHASGRGVKRDYGEALGWLIVARKHGADPSTENALRAQIKSQPSWIAKGERRAKEIEADFTGKKVAELLPPPHPLDAIAETPTPTGPKSAASAPAETGLTKPKIDLRPAAPSKPELPGLPPPSIKP